MHEAGISRAKAALACVGFLLFATPFLAAVSLGTDFTYYANESVAYRFFASVRALGASGY